MIMSFIIHKPSVDEGPSVTDLLKLDETEQALALAQLPTSFAVLFKRGNLSVEYKAKGEHPAIRSARLPAWRNTVGSAKQ